MICYQLTLKILWVRFLGGYAIKNMAYILIMSSVPVEYSQLIVTSLLEKHLIACGTILEGKSWFHWKGRVEQQDEAFLIMKSRSDKWDAIQKTITRLHPYDIPEIISMPILSSLPEYLSWIDGVLNHDS
jgi:periplasmic divalent cation tolerance protein